MTFIVILLPICFVLLALIMFFLTPQVPENQKIARPTGAIFLIAGGWSWWYFRRFFVRAERQGLTWHLPRRKGSCGWSEVTDYYLTHNQKDQTDYVIEVPGQTLWLVSQAWSNLGTLQAMVQQETRLRLGYEWEVRGSRAQEKFPQTFRYSKINSIGFSIMGWIGGVGIVVLCPFAIVYGESETMHQAGHIARLVRAVLMIGVCGGVAALYAQLVRIGNDNRKRLDEMLTVDTEGITLSTPMTSTFIRWSEITAYRRESSLLFVVRYIIEASHAEIRYTSLIHPKAVLRTVIERFVPPELRHDANATKPPAQIPESRSMKNQR